MFRKGQEKKLKFAIKKKKGGGGAASYIVGCVFFGVVMIGSSKSINAEEVKSHNNSLLEVNNIKKDNSNVLKEEIDSIDSLNLEKSKQKAVDSEATKEPTLNPIKNNDSKTDLSGLTNEEKIKKSNNNFLAVNDITKDTAYVSNEQIDSKSIDKANIKTVDSKSNNGFALNKIEKNDPKTKIDVNLDSSSLNEIINNGSKSIDYKNDSEHNEDNSNMDIIAKKDKDVSKERSIKNFRYLENFSSKNDSNIDNSISKKSLIRKNRSLQNDSTIVQPEQFHEYFIGDPGGSQIIPENVKNNKIILTPDKQNQVGGITLKNKIGLDEDFTWIGKVGFGNKEMINNDGNLGNTDNADGISFILHSGNPGELGAAGANMGAGGLPNVLGLKLDTYRNLMEFPDPNSNDLNRRLGWEADKSGVGKPGFGAIIKTVYTDERGVSGWRVKQDYNSYQDLPYRPKKWFAGKNDYYPLDEGNMIVNYNSSGNGTLVFRYKDIVWKIPDVKKYYEDKGINAVSFSIQSSTGAFSSENSMKFENFVYKAVNGDVVINSGSKVYDGKIPDFKSATIQIFTKDGGVKEQPFEFKNSDFSFYSKDNPNKIVNPIDVGEYIIKLSDSGKQRIANENLGYLGNLDIIKGKYTITPRPITIKANDVTISSNETPNYTYTISGKGIVNNDDLGIQVENSDPTNQKPGIHNGVLIPKVTKPNDNYEITIKNGNLTIIDTKDNEKYEPSTTPIEKPYGEATTEKEVIDHVKVPDGSNG
ncbi:TPA: hypothetical protein I9135_003016, partial [Clostridium perfringens]|nr:hypothetical protein [Clostridium perfringens]